MTAVAGPAPSTVAQAATAPPSVARRRRRRSGLSTGLQALLIGVWCLLPVYWMIAASFRPRGEVTSTTPWPAHPTLANYADAFAPLNELGPAFLHSFELALSVTAVTILLSTLGAYVIARLTFPGRGLVLGGVLAASMLPAAALIAPLFALLSHAGWAGTFQALFIPDLALALPLGVIVLSTSLRDMPWELEDAALLDGCTRVQAFIRVLLPLMAPAVVTVALLTFIATWNEYVVAYALSVQRTVTVTVVVADFAAELTGAAPTMAAGTAVALPLVLLVLVFQRRITNGLIAGALKG
jgi:multiple sugar transport system permease protein